MRKEILNKIKFMGYHDDPRWIQLYCESRIGLNVALTAYKKGQALKRNGRKCNCCECQKKEETK